jgi:hypothetical protein
MRARGWRHIRNLGALAMIGERRRLSLRLLGY